MQSFFDNLSFDDLIKGYATATADRSPTARGPFVLPDTVAKVYRIVSSLKKHGDGKVAFSFAGPANGGIPNMTPQYGDANSLLYGGCWWGGNLKGMLYNLV